MTMHVREYSFATPIDLGGEGNYQRFCTAIGLPPISDGWGFLHCENEKGDRWTAVTSDVDYLRLIVAGQDSGALTDLELPPDKFPNRREGWPDDWV